MSAPYQFATQLSDVNHTMKNSSRMQQPVRVLLVDDSTITLQGLKSVLSKTEKLKVVATASSETEAMAALETCRPDVVVLDVRVGRASGIDLCRAIQASYPSIVVFFFTAHDSKELLHEAILAGAQGYLLKTASGEAVAKSVEIVSTGQAILDQQLTPQVMAWVREVGSDIQEKGELNWSSEDLRLLSLLASGKTNKEIARDLRLTQGSVSSRVQKLYRRLKISRRAEAARYFIQLEKEVAHTSHSDMEHTGQLFSHIARNDRNKKV